MHNRGGWTQRFAESLLAIPLVAVLFVAVFCDGKACGGDEDQPARAS